MSSRRPHRVEVTLTDDELARLDEIRPRGVARAAYLRRLLHEPPKETEIATHGEALAILTALAREGRVTAAQALARELREVGGFSEMDWILDAK